MKKFLLLPALFLAGATIISIETTHAYTMKPVEPPEGGHGGHEGHSHAQESGISLSGKIVETMNSGGYTYILIEKDGKQTWAAIRETNVSVGQAISLQPGHAMVNFESKTLNRTFDMIVFSPGIESQHTSSMAQQPAGIGSKGTVVHSDEEVKVEKASGDSAYTVAELHEKSSQLDKKNVHVRGKVMKVSVGIMGRNWLHIQDGTGDEKKNTHDLVVTTQDKASVGDIVLVNGTLYKDKDFGSGYKYDAIIEQAYIKKE
ncbi:MAG: DNA-binding protein [Candidatus Brocadiaceae bacterium]|nr:DNA-binding protein [Candidatus Brocadiaceae bacterium]